MRESELSATDGESIEWKFRTSSVNGIMVTNTVLNDHARFVSMAGQGSAEGDVQSTKAIVSIRRLRYGGYFPLFREEFEDSL